jgi:hypothetical protein
MPYLPPMHKLTMPCLSLPSRKECMRPQCRRGWNM